MNRIRLVWSRIWKVLSDFFVCWIVGKSFCCYICDGLSEAAGHEVSGKRGTGEL
jgi:hypothetical protein